MQGFDVFSEISSSKKMMTEVPCEILKERSVIFSYRVCTVGNLQCRLLISDNVCKADFQSQQAAECIATS